jgi:hypothetical protein
MELKKFKEFRPSTSEILEQYRTSQGNKVEIKKISDSFAVCIDGLQVEHFKSKEAALEAADDAIDAIESLGNDE